MAEETDGEEDGEDGKSYQKGKTLVNPKKLRKLLLPQPIRQHQVVPKILSLRLMSSSA